jgi:hypothetical protein
MQEGLFVLSGPDGDCSTNSEMSLTCDLLSPIRPPAAQDRSIKVYPQPAHDRLVISLTNDLKGQEKVNIRLLDIHGRLLQRWEKETGSGELQLHLAPDLPPGFYLLQVRIGRDPFTRKIIIR